MSNVNKYKVKVSNKAIKNAVGVTTNRFIQQVNRANMRVTDYKIKNDIRAISMDELLKMRGGFNQEWLAQRLPQLFVRENKTYKVGEYKSKVGYNRMISPSEFISQFETKEEQKQALEEYADSLKDLTSMIGVKHSEIENASVKALDTMSRWLQNYRAIEEGQYFEDGTTSREWSSGDWETVDKLKQYTANSDDAVDIVYHLKNSNYTELNKIVKTSNKEIKDIINSVLELDEDDEELFI